ncbi:MAG: amino acid adenylation domain-containing protein [Melioribacteraceae bacterium]
MSKQNKNIESIYELTPMQQGMLFHSIYNPNSKNYFEQLSVTISGELNIDDFKQAWILILKKYNILRTSFIYKKLDKMFQVVHNDVELPFIFFDWTSQSKDIQKTELNNYFELDKEKGFSLNKAPLMRISLIRLFEKKYKLIWSHHHILFDGWSLPIVLRDLFKFYESLLNKTKIQLEYTRPYHDYIKYLQNINKENDLLFWKNYLKDFKEKTPLIVDKIPFYNESSEYKKISISLDKDISEKILMFVRAHKLTLNTVLQSCWAILLHKYSRTNDIVFGATFSGRPAALEYSESMVGLFINTLPVRAKIDPQMSILEWIKQFNLSVLELKDHEHTALVEIQRNCEIPSKQNLFDSLFVFENYPADESLINSFANLKFSEFSSFEQTNYPLTIVSGPGTSINVDAAFDQSIISETAISLLLNHFRNILLNIVFKCNDTISSIDYLDPLEKEFLIPIKYMDAELEEPHIFIKHFEKIVEKYPDNIAIRFEEIELTYKELNENVNKLSNLLLKRNIKSENLVGIYINRSVEMIVSILSVLKTGAGYVPIDTSYPKDRVNYIVKDSKISLLISENKLVEDIEFELERTILIDSLHTTSQSFSNKNPEIEIFPENIAYIIYTSGSTGKPKGTILQNKSVYNFLRDFSESLYVNPKSRILQFASIGFDASVPEIFSPLLNGGSVQLITKEQINDFTTFGEFVIKNKVTNLLLPPSVLSVIDFICSPDLETVLSAGEACSWNVVEKWSKKYRFINGYGPTEASVGCTWGQYSSELNVQTVPIGIPAKNIKVYVLDENLNPVPIGVEGELYVGENALARGYLNLPELTASRFIPNPFSEIGSERIYQTKDLVKVMSDGQLEFVGRVDTQVKLRGFRIETGEIETILNQIEFIEQSAVVLNETEDRKLIAFIVSSKQENIDINELKNKLGSKLPTFMVPAHFEIIDALPLTVNKKIDRKKLSEFKLTERNVINETLGHITANEELFLNLVKNVLNIKNITKRDNFFSLGGHSLLAIKLASRIREAFDVELPLNIIFEKDTLGEMAFEINKIKNNGLQTDIIKIQKVDRNQDLDLSFSQQRMWFMQKFDPDNYSNNITSSFSLKGKLNLISFEKSINRIIERHEILRTYYSDKIGKPIQKTEEKYQYKMTLMDLSHLDDELASKEIKKIINNENKRIFDFSNLPLFNIVLLKRNEFDHVLILTMHHIISDGWSINILVRELIEFYSNEMNNKIITLPTLNIQYSDFSQWQRNWLSGQNLEIQLDYWTNELKNIPEKIDLPIDKPRPPVQTFNGNHLNFSFSEETTTEFLKFINSHNFTPYMVTLAIFNILLHKYANQNIIVVGSPIANRNHKEIENLIGFFVNTLAIKTEFFNNDRVIDVIKRIREKTLNAFLNQELPFEFLVDKLQPKREMSHSPIFQVAFIFQNTQTEKISLPYLEFNPIESENKIAKYDLSFYVQIRNEKIFVSIEYNTDLFEHQSIERMRDHYSHLLNSIIKNPQQLISEISLVDNTEFQNIYNGICLGRRSNILYENIIDKFNLVLNNHSNNIAVSFSEFDGNDLYTEQITYTELDLKSNQLARHLLKSGLKQEEIVGVSLKRSIDLIISILAVVKAGGAFVPIDPFYPSDRIEYMINDSNMKFLITRDELKPQFVINGFQLILLDKEDEQISSEIKDSLNISIAGENLAYVIYTSGSTGKPKGTLLNHKGLINLTQVQKEKFDINYNSKILQFSSLSFDAFVWEVFMALLNGASINLVTQEIISSIEQLLKVLHVLKITVVTLPPSVLNIIPQKYSNELTDLKTIIVAGEKCSNELVNKWQSKRKFFNAYGPTETTVCASMYLCDEKCDKNPPIGKPNENFSLYVLDPNMNLLPIGIPGELYISGIGLARGYLNLSNLTAEKFLPDPFSNAKGIRMYRTGDLVKYLPAGDIEFLGRIDNQIKLRGFRIELGEIESVIQSYSGIDDALVLLREDNLNQKQIVAYLIWGNTYNQNLEDLKIYLRKLLPEYMIPTIFVNMDRFPITPSNKIDTNALPKPNKSELSLTNGFVLPRNNNEKLMAEIGKELLNIDRMGIHDNFFELGGHSLLATQFLSRLNMETKKELTLKVFFENPTIAQLSEKLNQIVEVESSNEVFISKQERSSADLFSLIDELNNISDNEAKSLIEKD